MRDIPVDLGQRILQAARLATQLHLEGLRGNSRNHGLSDGVGGAGFGDVTDDARPASNVAAGVNRQSEAA